MTANDELEATLQRLEKHLGALRPTPTTTTTETTMSANEKTYDFESHDLNDQEATFAAFRYLATKLDDLTTQIAALAARPVAAAAAPHAAPAYGGNGGTGAPEEATWLLVEVFERTVPKRTGGTFTVPTARFSNGYTRDIPKGLSEWFAERIGQQVTILQAKQTKNGKTFSTIVGVK